MKKEDDAMDVLREVFFIYENWDWLNVNYKDESCRNIR